MFIRCGADLGTNMTRCAACFQRLAFPLQFLPACSVSHVGAWYLTAAHTMSMVTVTTAALVQ